MAQESCNLDKDEAELLKPSSSASTTSAAPPPPASAPSPTMYLKTTTTTTISQEQHHQLQPQQQVGPRTDAPKKPADSHATNSSFTRKRKLETSPPPEPDASSHVAIAKAQKTESTLDAPASARAVNRCSCCQKRVGLTGFRCRCGDLFCAAHRYSDAHGCSYDYKAAGRAEISKANPVVRAPKIIKI